MKAIDAYFADLRAGSDALSDPVFNHVRASTLVPKLGFPQSLEKTGGRDWDRTSDPCDVNAGTVAQPTDFAETARATRLCHSCTAYVLARWFNEPKSTV